MSCASSSPRARRCASSETRHSAPARACCARPRSRRCRTARPRSRRSTVSPLFPERLLVRLAPAELAVGAKRYPCDPAFGTEPWHGAVQALKGIAWPRSRVTVVLSNHFVRYALVPWSAARGAVPHPGGAWLVIAEPDRACVALHAEGAFRAVQNAKGEWRTLLERERYRAPHEGALPDLVLLAGAAAPADGDWKFRELAA